MLYWMEGFMIKIEELFNLFANPTDSIEYGVGKIVSVHIETISS
jgi:hypothetical protein